MKIWSTYNLLILNYAVTWLTVSVNFRDGATLFSCIWLILIAIKCLKLYLRKLAIVGILVIVGFFLPFLIPFFIIIPLVMFFSLIAKIWENWLLILIGALLYYWLFTLPPGILQWASDMLPLDIAYVFTFLFGIGMITLSTFLLKKVGYEKRSIETVLLSLPVFMVALFVGISLLHSDTSDH